MIRHVNHIKSSVVQKLLVRGKQVFLLLLVSLESSEPLTGIKVYLAKSKQWSQEEMFAVGSPMMNVMLLLMVQEDGVLVDHHADVLFNILNINIHQCAG